MWFRSKNKNRRLGRVQVLDVKLRSSQVMAARTRMAAMALGVSFATLFGFYVTWRLGQWTLDKLVYQNKSFAIQNIDAQTDGVIAPEQLRRWCAIKPGQNLLALDLARVKRGLELAPMIQSASVERVLPNTLRVRVTEREPVAQVNIPRQRAGGGIEVVIFQIDAEGYVLLPLDPRQRAVSVNQADSPLPLLGGISAGDLQPGRRIDSPSLRAALKLVAAFESSPMAGLVELRSIDVSRRDSLVVTTGQGSAVTFGTENFDRQLAYWQTVHEECVRRNKAIATLDLAVNENPPLRIQEAGPLPPDKPKINKPQRNRRRNV
jgi:cell division septal protein FtsQ